MPDVPPRPAPLVPFRRLGPALAAQRVRRTTSFVELSRQSGRRWAPDELRDVERAARILDDPSVIDIAHLYGIPGRPVPSGDGVELILDRSSASDLGGGPAESVGLADVVAVRLAAIGRWCDFDPAGAGVHAVVGLALAMEPAAVDEMLCRTDPERQRQVAATAEALADATVVPTVGLLVAETDAGALVLTGRRGAGRPRSRDGAAEPAAGRLEQLVGSSRPV